VLNDEIGKGFALGSKITLLEIIYIDDFNLGCWKKEINGDETTFSSVNLLDVF